MGIVFKNNAKTTLASSLSNSATSATVTDGSVFPSLSAGEFFLLTFDDGTNNEICKCTARSGNTLTIVRAQESTTARAFSSGDAAEGRVTAGVLETIQENIAAKSANQTVYNTTTASSATDYDIGIDPSVEANAMVFLNGVMQHHDTFSFSGSTLTFDAAPPNGMALEVIVDNLINLQSSNLTVDTFTATSGQTDFVLSDTPAAETNLIVFVDGVFQDQDSYTISNNTLTITDGVVLNRGVTVYVINPVNIGTPSDGTVTSAKLSGNITMPGTLTVGSNDVAFDSPTFVVDNANSRVGLGTASPSVPVDIVGDVKMSANLTVDTSTLVVDSANNRVGIGTDSPDEPLHIFSTTDADILLEGTEAGTSTRFAKVAFANNISGTTTDLGAITANTDGATNSSSFKFFTANAGSVTNKMTITSGDAVLVGKDSDAFATAGVVLATSQNSSFTRNSGNVLALRRNTNDGDLVTLYKDTTKIGSIASRGGTTASFITNTASGSGAGISGSTNMVIACDETGAANGSTVSLGSTSTKWKDLYLSGTAYIDTAVGIGTSSPASLLHIKSTAADASASIILENTNNAQSMNIDYYNNAGAVQSRIGYEEGPAAFSFKPNVSSTAMYIAYDGNVGIGQSSPGTTLHIGDGASHYVRIENAGSGDVASGYQIYRGASTIGMQLYDNPADNATTLLAQGTLNFIANGSGIDIKIKDNGSINFHGTGTANKSFEVQDRQSGYSSFWVDDNNRDYGRGITNAYGLLGGSSTQYDGDGATYPAYGFGGASDNHSSESLDFWIKSTTSEWQSMVFFAIAASTSTAQTGQTAGWALIRATHYNNSVSSYILDSGGGGTFSLSVVGSMDSDDYMRVRVAYSGGQNRCNISVWCSTYQHIRGVTR